MRMTTAAATPLRLEYNGKEYSFHPLTMADLAELEQAMLGVTKKSYVTVMELYEWSQTLDGAPLVLELSRRHGGKFTRESPEDFAGPLDLAMLAKTIMAASIASGEEPREDEGGGAKKKDAAVKVG